MILVADCSALIALSVSPQLIATVLELAGEY